MNKGDKIEIFKHASVRSSYSHAPKKIEAVVVRETKTTIVVAFDGREVSFSKSTRRELGSDKFSAHLTLG